jgi:hypothetical protein
MNTSYLRQFRIILSEDIDLESFGKKKKKPKKKDALNLEDLDTALPDKEVS